jgi:hypothetical protein
MSGDGAAWSRKQRKNRARDTEGNKPHHNRCVAVDATARLEIARSGLTPFQRHREAGQVAHPDGMVEGRGER